jgi:prevent-host-death family protein
MADTITARDANHHFSRLLSEVEAGAEYVVTRNGKPVARIVPERAEDGQRNWTPEQRDAWANMMAIIATAQPSDDPTPFDRDGLYPDRGA